MQKFTYSFPMRILYRYGNIPITMILLFYLFGSAYNLDKSLISLIPLIITALLIYFLNRQYLMLYKTMPFSIQVDPEKLVCTDFTLSKKEIVIYYKDIDKLTGGIFEGKINGLMKIFEGQRSLCISFFTTIKNSKNLQTIILSKVNKSLYDEVINKLKDKKETKEHPKTIIDKVKDKKKSK